MPVTSSYLNSYSIKRSTHVYVKLQEKDSLREFRAKE